ncbi:MAG: hypothetical protein ABI222_09310 [Opitutaceae bacterium]
MSLFLATLIFGLALAILGAALLSNRPAVVDSLKIMPRSQTAAMYFFGGGALWFLWLVWHLSTADFGDYHVLLTIVFALVAALAFKCVPDFLAVRGLCILVLLAASPFLSAAFMEYSHPQRLLMVTPIFLLIFLAIWLGTQPYRLRNFFEWLFARSGRVRGVGGVLLVYGLVLTGAAFTY